jgi:Spy/CpxP family protein refolding chaperone
MCKRIESTNYTIIAVAVMAITVLAGLDIQAQHGPRGGRDSRQGRMVAPLKIDRSIRKLRHLDLSENQCDQVRTLVKNYKQNIKALAKQLGPARKALAESMMSSTFDETLIRERSANVAEAETEMAVLRGLIHNDFIQLLTPEQIEKFQELNAKREWRHKKQRGRFKKRNRHP